MDNCRCMANAIGLPLKNVGKMYVPSLGYSDDSYFVHDPFIVI